MASQRERENVRRLQLLEQLENYLKEQGEDVIRISAIKSASKNNYSLAIPTLDEDDNEMTLRIEVSCFRTDVDPYAMGDEYQDILREQAEKEAERKKSE